ncbi:MAG: hypothetical protein U1E05_13545, partial [Patescibacteria group bacterium]|nr:hypothetical protein [Patescibacteria group bacterium]
MTSSDKNMTKPPPVRALARMAAVAVFWSTLATGGGLAAQDSPELGGGSLLRLMRQPPAVPAEGPLAEPSESPMSPEPELGPTLTPTPTPTRTPTLTPTPPPTAPPAPTLTPTLSPAPNTAPNTVPARPRARGGFGKIAGLNIKNMTMQQVARLVAQGTGQQVTVSQGAAATQIHAYLEFVTVEEALRAICLGHGLWFRQDKTSGIITVVTIDEYQKGLNAYPQETVEIITVLYPDVRAIGDALQRLFSNRVVWNPPDDYRNDPIMDVERALERMDALADRAQFSLTGTEGGGSYGSRRSSRSSRSSAGSRTGYATTSTGRDGELVEDVERHVDPETLRARLADSPDLEQPAGERVLQPGVVYVSAFKGTNDLMLRSADADSVREVIEVIKRLDKPTPQVLLEVKVLDITLDDEEAFGVDWLFQSGDLSGGRSTGINRTNFGTQFASILTPTPTTLVPRGTGLDPRTAVLQVVTDDVLARIQMLQDRGRLVSL